MYALIFGMLGSSRAQVLKQRSRFNRSHEYKLGSSRAQVLKH